MNTARIEFWSGRRVLITGHTGFKGSWLTLWLKSLDAELRGIALKPPVNQNIFDICKVATGIDHQIADIRDFEKINKLVKEFQPEIIFHLAAQPIVRLSYEQPVQTYSTNIMGTVNVLESALQAKCVKSFVNVTTDKCYENNDLSASFRENDKMGGYDPYSSSKACSEIISAAYRRSYFEKAGISIATARAGNVIGGGDWALDRLIPDVLRAFKKNHAVTIRNSNAVRPWQHVLEPLSGYLLLAERLFEDGKKYSGGWNFGPKDNDCKQVSWIVDKLCELWEIQIERLSSGQGGPYESGFLMLDITKARQLLGWEPVWPLNATLKKITDWHKGFENGDDMATLSLMQIQEYESDALYVQRPF